MRLETAQAPPGGAGAPRDHEPIWVLLDTGANNWLSLPMAYVKPRTDILSGRFNPQASSRGISGQINDVRSKLKAIDLFGMQLHEVPVTIEMAPTAQPDARDDPRPPGQSSAQGLHAHLRLPPAQALGPLRSRAT